jgi:uncharacterized PurR-regulated membrane protein YhhQ (DUF165 family)
MEVAAAVEHRRPVKETPAQRLAREIGAFFSAVLRTLLISAMITPLLLLAFLTADMPVRRFDHLFDIVALKPGQWLSVGGLVMTCVLPLTILITRRFGGDEAGRAVTVSWLLAAFATFVQITDLAPAIEGDELPGVRLVVAFVASAMVGQFVAVTVYDLTRGGGVWWRPPLLAALIGYAAHTLLYFPIAYWNGGNPWTNWLITDYAVKALAALAFLPLYHALQKPLRPRGGYGG